MGLIQSPSVRSGDSLDGMISDYVNGKAKMRAHKRNSARLVAFLTFLQFAFAIYATFLLYYMSPTVDLRTKPDFAWATRIANHWKQFIIQPQILGTSRKNLVLQSEYPIPSEVCEHEKIDFSQKRSIRVRV